SIRPRTGTDPLVCSPKTAPIPLMDPAKTGSWPSGVINFCRKFMLWNLKIHSSMANSYYDPADLRKFGKITEWSEELGTKFFDYYGKVFEEGALSAREKSLIALAVSHVVK